MWLDICMLALIIYAFSLGFQKGVFKTFSIWISGAIACVLTLWQSPRLLLFLEYSLSQYRNSFDMWVLLSMFIVLTFFIYLILRAVWKQEDEKRNAMNKLSGGVLFSSLMFGSIVIMLSFADQANLLSEHVKAESKVVSITTPIKDHVVKAVAQWKKNVKSTQAAQVPQQG